MGTDNLQLTELTESQLLNHIKIHKEWVIDNAILRRFSDDIIKQIVGIRMNYLAQEANLAGQMLENQAAMFQNIAKLMGFKG